MTSVPPSRPEGRGGSKGGRGRGGGGGGGGRGGRSGRGERDNDAPPSQSETSEAAGGPRKRRHNRGGRKKAEAKPPEPSPEELQKLEEERFAKEAAEAERKRLEAEAKAAAAAAEAARKAREDLQTKALEARDLLKVFVETVRRHQTYRQALAPDALAASRKDFVAKKKTLKTDLKKCTAFVKKVKSGSAWSLKVDDLYRDVQTLNLSRYVEEVAASTLESKPKIGDLPTVVAVCAAMHERYPEFLANLLPAVVDVVTGKGDVETLKSRRLYVRLLTELVLSGLVTETKTLMKCITEASGAKDDYNVQDPNLVVAFGKAAGSEVFGVQPKTVREALALFQQESVKLASDETGLSKEMVEEGMALACEVEAVMLERAVDADVAQTFNKHCQGAYQFLADSLVQTHNKLQKLEKRCEQDRLLSGTLTEAREKGLADARKLKENLQKSVESLSDVLDLPVPHLVVEDEDADDGGGLGVEVWTKEGGENDLGPFDDEETRDFYCDIPDLLTTVPPALLGMTPEQIEKRKEENLLKYGKDTEAESVGGGEDAPEVTPATEEELEAEEAAFGVVAEEEDVQNEGEEDKEAPRYKLMVLLDEELPECNRKEQVDELTERFCTNHGSSRNSRKRLARTLFMVPRARLDLLPFYSRMTATIDRLWSDIATPLVTELEQQFHGQTKFKKNQNLDSRLKTARYIGELTKFRVAPPIVFMRCLRRCLDDFTGSNVDVACCLLESCGRFLYRMKHTNAKVAALMETMTRLSKAKNLDERSQSLVKAAFFTVKPPPSGPKKLAKQYPPVEAYLRDLLMVRLVLDEQVVGTTSKQIVRLPWSDPSQQCGALCARLMMKSCRKGRYRTIKAIAKVAERLRTQKVAGEVTVRLIDAVLEELRWALEHPNFRDQQRVITYARLLGELFDANQVSGQLVIRQLYDFINVGHEIPEALREASKQLGTATSDDTGDRSTQLPVYNSATGISQTIMEDEEMDEDNLESKQEEPAPEAPQPVAVSEHSLYDPRVPSPIDPPSSAYRIKLVCTLLEVAAKSIVSRNNLPRLKGFLAAFQRYLFTKTMLPADVEFALLDTFDVLDSRWRQVTGNKRAKEEEEGFPRYATWLEAHNATVAMEHDDAVAKADHPEGPNDEDEDTLSNYDDEDSLHSTSGKDSATDHREEDPDMVSEADGDASDNYGTSGAEDTDDDSDDSASYSDEEEEFDEEEYMRQLEEEAFERELRRVTMDALEKGKNLSRKQVADYMPVGSQITRKKSSDPAAADTALPLAIGGKAGISFQVLKKGNKGKVEAKEIVVPVDTNLAKAATRQDDAKALEHDVIKQRVLQYEADSAFAEDSGGNVYLEQEKLQVIRNRLSMDDIDKNFGTSGGNLVAQSDKAKAPPPAASSTSVRRPSGRGGSGRGRGAGGGGGRGRGRSSSSGRTLFR